MRPHPYDELLYRGAPVEWTAPERLALASLLHGGPRTALAGYRLLELGCGSGENLLPMAFHRPHGSFVGLDAAARPLALAESRRASLGVSNVRFVQTDIRRAAEVVDGSFEFILAHGVFSWVPDAVRDALLSLAAERLSTDGLLYVNYNARPGWDVRGLVRGLLLRQTAAEPGLEARAELAQDIAARLAPALSGLDHAFSRLLEDELRFVCEGERSWVAHEYLCTDNRAYWRGEVAALFAEYGFFHVADADYDYDFNRTPEGLLERLAAARLAAGTIEEVADLCCYRQIQAPIFARGPFARRPPDHHEFGDLLLASDLAPVPATDPDGTSRFRHWSGCEVEAREPAIDAALRRLHPLWPRGERVAALVPEVPRVMDDLCLLHRHGLVELRCGGAIDFPSDASPLHTLERAWGGYITTPHHRVRRDE